MLIHKGRQELVEYMERYKTRNHLVRIYTPCCCARGLPRSCSTTLCMIPKAAAAWHLCAAMPESSFASAALKEVSYTAITSVPSAIVRRHPLLIGQQ